MGSLPDDGTEVVAFKYIRERSLLFWCVEEKWQTENTRQLRERRFQSMED